MNLAKILKDRRDAERRLELTSPKPVFNGGVPDSIEGGGNEIISDGVTLAQLTAGLAGKSNTDHVHEFIDLTDAPANYTGQSGKNLIVKSTEDGIEFGAGTTSGIQKVTISKEEWDFWLSDYPDMAFIGGTIEARGFLLEITDYIDVGEEELRNHTWLCTWTETYDGGLTLRVHMENDRKLFYWDAENISGSGVVLETPRSLPFVDLMDVPSAYTGAGGKIVAVNSAATALEFIAAPAAANGVPAGGTTDQLAAKNSNTDFDLKWVDAPNAANGIPTGGTTEQILSKIDGTDYNAHWVDKPTDAESLLTKVINIADFTGKDGYILAYDEVNGEFYLKADDGGGGDFAIGWNPEDISIGFAVTNTDKPA